MDKRLNISDFNALYTQRLGGSVYINDDITVISGVSHLPFWNKMEQFDFALVIFCRRGSIQAVLNDVSYVASQGDILFCCGLHIITAAMLSTDFMCDIFCVSMRKYHEIITPDKELLVNMLFAYDRPLIHLSPGELELVECYEKLLWTKMNEVSTCYSHRIISAIVKAMILEFASACERRIGGDFSGSGSLGKRNIAHDFLLLLSEDVSRRHTVSYFADRLCVSAKYLSHIVKRETGKTVSVWIHEQLTEQIRNMLLNTSLSCKEIAITLGFPNSSFFGRYVKSRFGCSPTQFRSRENS
ncbi:MAG: helix-turn-helix domain-containing protein [Muribaculaceae bacterium]